MALTNRQLLHKHSRTQFNDKVINSTTAAGSSEFCEFWDLQIVIGTFIVGAIKRKFFCMHDPRFNQVYEIKFYEISCLRQHHGLQDGATITIVF